MTVNITFFLSTSLKICWKWFPSSWSHPVTYCWLYVRILLVKLETPHFERFP